MSLSNYSNLSEKYPEYTEVWDAIGMYQRQYPAAGFIPMRKVVRSLRGRDAVKIFKAFETLVETGLSRRVFVIVLPKTGDVIGDLYESIEDVPDVVDGLFEEQVKTSEAEIIPCYTLSD